MLEACIKLPQQQIIFKIPVGIRIYSLTRGIFQKKPMLYIRNIGYATYTQFKIYYTEYCCFTHPFFVIVCLSREVLLNKRG